MAAADQPDDLTAEFAAVFGGLEPQAAAPAYPGQPAQFNETRYLRVYPDVAEAIRQGDYAYAYQHYEKYGRDEGRLDAIGYRHAWPIDDAANFPAFGLDAVFWTPSGRVLLIGWINDALAPLVSASLLLHETTLGATDAIARCRREDAEHATGAAEGRLLGFWTVFRARTDVPIEDVKLVLATTEGTRAVPANVQPATDERLRELALEYLAHASYWGHPHVEGFHHLAGGIGAELIALNDRISAGFAASAFCRRFGPQRGRFAASIIVCLYGRMEYTFLQAAMFSTGADYGAYEFIYVSNSPELAERLMKEAALIARIYGIAISIVVLPGNAGFGVANNAAVNFAQSDRIMIVNPDVFPREADWATRHLDVVGNLPESQTRIFGVPLYYDDGSLMHAGMHFEMDEGLSIQAGGIRQCDLVRVEHYGKGAPPGTARFLRARPVPAVTGAFISLAREWYETLGGFSPDYVFGHYEDADLCLRSLDLGTKVWLHNVPFWHMEGKGSTRRAVHEGGSLVNRWHFTRNWGAALHDGLLGPAPARFADGAPA